MNKTRKLLTVLSVTGLTMLPAQTLNYFPIPIFL